MAFSFIQPFGHNTHGPKIGGLCHFSHGGTGFPRLTMLPGPRPTFVPIGILIHPAIWPQWIWAENWGCAPFGGAGSHITQCGRCLPPCQVSSSSIQPFGHNTPTLQADRQTEHDRQTVRQDKANRCTNGRPKTDRMLQDSSDNCTFYCVRFPSREQVRATQAATV